MPRDVSRPRGRARALAGQVPAAAWAAFGVVVAVVAVILVGAANPIPPPPIATDAVGPENTETAAQYVARAAATLSDADADADVDADADADADAPRWALVSFRRGVSADAAAGSAGGVRISEVLVHVPADGEQTPVVAIQTPATDDPSAMVARAQQRAADQLAQGFPGQGSAAASPAVRSGPPEGAGGRPDLPATVEASLRGGCACVTGLIVRAGTGALRAVASGPSVAAVDALPPDAVFGRFAVRPLAPLEG